MFKSFFAVAAALILVSCGGGSGSGPMQQAALSTTPSLAKSIAQSPALLAGDVSLVNTTTQGNQVLRTIGATADGGYVVAWFSNGTLYIQAYDSAGAKTGPETPIALDVGAQTAAAAAQAIEQSSIAVLTDGTVVVAYRLSRNSDQPNGTVLTTTGVYFQRFDANGVQIMGETVVTSRQDILFSRSPVVDLPKVVALSDGGFVVGWDVSTFSAQFGSISTLNLRWFDSEGQPVGSPTEVGVFPALRYSLVADTHGGFTLTTYQMDNFFNIDVSTFHYDPSHVFLQVVAPRLGSALLLPLANGFAVFLGDSSGATAQILDSQGNPVSAPTAIPSVPVAALELADGSYVAIWPSGAGYVAQRFAADGTTMGSPVAIASDGTVPSVVALVDTGFAAAWTAAGAAGDTDVFTQRFIDARFSDRKKACLESAKGLKGQERKAFMDACVG